MSITEVEGQVSEEMVYNEGWSMVAKSLSHYCMDDLNIFCLGISKLKRCGLLGFTLATIQSEIGFMSGDKMKKLRTLASHCEDLIMDDCGTFKIWRN
jgi:hypothetical protein